MMGFANTGWSMGFGIGIFGLILIILFWGVIIWLVFWLISQNVRISKNISNNNNNHISHNSNNMSSDENSDPKMILKTRYAKGEITKKEYYELKKDLEDLTF